MTTRTERQIAIIPARGGSKRIPRKNIKHFKGMPIIEYSIAAAKNAGVFDLVMVSTEDQEIAEISRKAGAEVPFLRSAKAADDFASTVDVLEEVLGCFREKGEEFDYVCCIYPTAPFVTDEKLRYGMSKLQELGADCVLPVVRFSYPIQRALKLQDDRVEMFWPENYESRSQDLPAAYHDCGQYYCLRVSSLLEQRRLFPKVTAPIVTPEREVQDIDSEEDWFLAEVKYQLFLEQQVAKQTD